MNKIPNVLLTDHNLFPSKDISWQNDKLKKQNALYLFEREQVIDAKKKTEEKIKKEVEKRENIKKTFKQVVGREKVKWEKNTVSQLVVADLYS